MRHRIALLVPCVIAAAVSACSPSQSSSPGGTTTSSAPKAHIVEYAATIEFSNGDTATWVDGTVDSSGPAEPTVKPIDNEKHSAKFASKVQFLTPQGCKQPFGDLKVDSNGLGQTPCTWETYEQVDHYAPQIWIDNAGQIVKIADRYHP